MKKQILASLLSLLVALAVESVYAQQSFRRSDIRRAEFILSRIDETVTNEFRRAWRAAGAGADQVEAVVLLYHKIDGSLMARSLRLTYRFQQFRFDWNSAIIAVVHTHPTNCGSLPQSEDIRLADKFGVPVFTITYRGMFMYDPDTKRISRVKSGLDWLDPSKWDQNSRVASSR